MQPNLLRVRVVNLWSLVSMALGAYILVRFVDALTVTLLFFVLALVLAIALDGPICWLQRRGMSRGFSIALFVFLFIIAGVAGLYFAAPALGQQVQFTLDQMPAYSHNLQQRLSELTRRYPAVGGLISQLHLQQRLTELGQTALPRIGRFSLDLLSGLIACVLLAAVTVYSVANPAPLIRGGLRMLPRRFRPAAIRIYRRTLTQLQAWARATFWLMLIVGVVSGLGLWAIGVPSPLVFGIVAGLGEAIPIVGPIVSCLPPLLVMLSADPVKALWVVALFVVVQQLEGNLLVPRIMASVMKMHPVPVLFCVVVMGTLTGPLGLLLAIPLYAILQIVLEETYMRRINKRNRPAASVETGS